MIRKFFSSACILLAAAFCSHAAAQSSPASAHAPAHPPSPASSSIVQPITQPIYPLSKVHAGLHGTAYTVFQGSKPEPIDVEILGVLHDTIGPGKDMILARLGGTQAEYDGVVAGMSGSPVYIDGKLAGAIGFRIGQFTKQPMAGITPIEQMLEVFNAGDSSEKNYRGNKLASDPVAFSLDTASNREKPASTVSSPASPWTPAADTQVQTIGAPLVFDGLSSQAIDMFQQRFHAYGLTPV